MSTDNAQAASGAAGATASDKSAGDSGSSNSKVNAIWQQLKSAHGAPKAQGVNFNKLWHGFHSDSAQGKVKPGTTKSAPERGIHQPTPDPVAPKHLQPQPQPQPQPLQPSISSKPDANTALQLVARCVAGLKDSSQAARRRALQDVQVPAESVHSWRWGRQQGVATSLLDNPALSEQWLTERLEGDGLGKALLRRFDDPSDTCREMAVTGLLRLLQAAPGAVLSLLPYAFPVVSERVRHREESSKTLTEPCEEVRVALARLLRCLVTLAGKSFGGYAGEAVELVGALCEDPFHVVQEEACGVVVDMNDVLGLRLQPVARQLVAAVLPLTTAKRHRVRVAALQALRPTMHQGAHEMILEMVAWRDPNVIPVKAFYGDDLKVNFCGKLAADPHPAVRREFLAVVGDWMTGLRERLDHESRLLPFVLSALNDEAPEIQADAVGLLERLGIQYEQDHEKDLKDALSYLPEEAHGIGWQAPGAAGYVYGTIAAGEEATVNGGRAVFVLPGPLRGRPRLGTRRLVQSNFGRVVGALSEELVSWLVEARRRAAALLRTELVLVEEWSEQHLHLVIPALTKVTLLNAEEHGWSWGLRGAITDPEVRSLIRDCCAVIGAFTDPELALQLLQPRLMDEAMADLGHRAAALEVLACVIRGAGPRRTMDPHLGAVLELLTAESLITCEDSRIRKALLEVVEQLVATCGPACNRHNSQLLWLCLHLRAPGREATALQPPPPAVAAPAVAALGTPGEAAAAMESGTGGGGGPGGAVVEASLLPRLAEVCGFSGGVDEMMEAHRAELLAQLDPSSSPNVLLATGVLCRLILPYSSLSYLLYLPDEVLGRVLPPEPPSNQTTSPLTTTPMELDDNNNDNDQDADGDAGRAAAVAAAVEEAATDAMEEDGAGRAAAAATAAPSPSGRRLDLYQHPHAHSRSRSSWLWFWQSTSTSAVLSHLKADLTSWLPRQPRCAMMCLISLEACLNNLPVRDQPTAAAAAPLPPPDEQLATVLILALGACKDLSPPALLAALRCAHAALRRRLLAALTTTSAAAAANAPASGGGGGALHTPPPPAPVHVRLWSQLVQRLADCMSLVGSAACRLQACNVLEMLVGCPDAAAAVLLSYYGDDDKGGCDGDVDGGDHDDGDGGVPALQTICTAISSRLYDAADEVRCAALALARQVVVLVASASQEGGRGAAGGGSLEGIGSGRGGGAVTRLLTEISQLRDVSPGSGFYDEWHAFHGWMEQLGR
ncbi:hypothetical protein VOLCADRAFT_106220 [Volvox carteri f. nagariensis]|uniref:TOG domain-containing protein n=1 Tax=Volvox carteri f. nagariensis TaxID=3068 RepID=D8U5W6_VOLCA|nr:uncharacterized protein VOLCADRAFT_106220 [Volvox carteri f. nagariensis]EFJ44828.1 hypothetical protein VOLCADRAFT_106220 [Volvox carteri f. nagariensis]|eukprot:XP_002954111.1 hypothetical protein VOLCADRAFT_106220 [Volvox carteri f. nagariensis]